MLFINVEYIFINPCTVAELRLISKRNRNRVRQTKFSYQIYLHDES